MAEHFPPLEHGQHPLAGQMDMSAELAHQAAVEAEADGVVSAPDPGPDSMSSVSVSAAQTPHSVVDQHTHADHNSPAVTNVHAHVHAHVAGVGGVSPSMHLDSPEPLKADVTPAYAARPRPMTSVSGGVGGVGISSRAGSSAPAPTAVPFSLGPPHRQAPDSPLTNSQQLVVLREFYARNPNPGKRDLEMLALRTGRSWTKIREYFRQRRNKLRGLVDLEGMEEPGRATGWLQVTYRAGSASSTVSQLSLYNAYKQRFDPYSTVSPLLGGQDLIHLACATFPGCEISREDGDYVLRGLRDKGSPGATSEWERGMDSLVEPLRGTSWLLSSFQHQADPTAPPSLSQTELYTTYATRFSHLLPDPAETPVDGSQDHATPTDPMGHDSGLKDYHPVGDDGQHIPLSSFMPSAGDADTADANTTAAEAVAAAINASSNGDHANLNAAAGSGAVSASAGDDNDPDDDEQNHPGPSDNRLLNPVELITLCRMCFPKCEPAIDHDGRFVIRGLERREGVEKARQPPSQDMFPFSLVNGPAPSDPDHPFTALVKRKLAQLTPNPTQVSEDSPPAKKRMLASGIGVNLPVQVPHVPSVSSPVSAQVPVPVSGRAHGILPALGQMDESDLDAELGDDEREMLEGLARFRHSKFGNQVRDICVQQ